MNGKAFITVFLISLATLSYEILLTRLWSVSLWYHFAFASVSLAMLGSAAAGVFVFLNQRYFLPLLAKEQIIRSSLCFTLSVTFGLFTQLSMPFFPDLSLVGIWSFVLLCCLSALPFFFFGLCIVIAFKTWPERSGAIYAVDLLGAAAGCLIAPLFLTFLDGPAAILTCALLAVIVPCLSFPQGSLSRCLTWSIALVLFLVIGANVRAGLIDNSTLPLRLLWVKGKFAPAPLYEKWNSMSRIAVEGDANKPVKPFSLGMSTAAPHVRVRQLDMLSDAFYSTPMTFFDGDLSKVEFLKYDISAFPYYLSKLKAKPDIAIIGVGGGRDILTALAFQMRSIDAVDINNTVIDCLKGKYAAFTGHLGDIAGVRLINREARSFMAGQDKHYDLIQLSFINTGAATAAGAFALAENPLYTVECWKLLEGKLKDDGILACTRRYDAQYPAELYRLTALAAQSLRDNGIACPGKHIVIVRPTSQAGENNFLFATLLVSKQSWTNAQILEMQAIVRKLNFEIVLSPASLPNIDVAPPPVRPLPDITPRQNSMLFKQIVESNNLEQIQMQLPTRIVPSTDDCPYFFFLSKGILSPKIVEGNATSSKAGLVLVESLVVLSVLTLLFVICPFFPYFFRWVGQTTAGNLAFEHIAWLDVAVLFICSMLIGSGFVFIEISQMQRLAIVLGHPTYGLTVVLFCMLAGAGLGSYLSELFLDAGVSFAEAATCEAAKVEAARSFQLARIRQLVITVMPLLLLFIYAMGVHGSSKWVGGDIYQLDPVRRISLTAAPLFLTSMFAGSVLPTLLSIARFKCVSWIPWFWAVNGASSVVASVLAQLLAIQYGLLLLYWCGFISYFLTAIFICLYVCLPVTEKLFD